MNFLLRALFFLSLFLSLFLSPAGFFQSQSVQALSNPFNNSSLPPQSNPDPQASSSLSKDTGSSLNGSEVFTIRLISPYKQVKKGSPFLAGIQIKMRKGWYTYWSFAGDFGIAPHIKLKSADGIQIKTLPLPRPQRKDLSLKDKSFYSFIYQNELLIPLEILIPDSYKKESLDLSLDLEWGVCKEICLNKNSPLWLRLKISSDFQEDPQKKIIFDFWKTRLPQEPGLINLKSHFSESDSKQILSFSFDSKIECLDAFPKSRLDFSTKKPKLIQQKENSCSFEFIKSKNSLEALAGLLIYSQQRQSKSSWFFSQKKASLALIWFAFMAFLGGLILNFMPCVLPIIFLKFYNNLQIRSFSRKNQLLLNGSYSAGVILSFLLLALIILIAKKSGESLGWGFHLQSPPFVISLALLFTLMGFYLLDFFSLSVPNLPKLFKDEKILSHFLTGVLSTSAASPCTVPFMATAVGFAFSRSYLEIFTIFFFLGLGLSFPYLLLSFFPQVFKLVPSPGAWSELLKKLFSIPLFLTSLWLLSILYLQLDFKAFFLSLVAFPLLAGFVFLPKQFSNPVFKKASGFGFVVLILLVLFGQNQLNSASSSRALKKEVFLPDSNWQSFDENKLNYQLRKGGNVLVAFGAEWCLTCKLNERFFKTKDFQELVDKYDVRLFYGDWTSRTDSITSFLEKYSRQGVPFYIFYQGEEKAFILPSLLTEKNFHQKLEELAQ